MSCEIESIATALLNKIMSPNIGLNFYITVWTDLLLGLQIYSFHQLSFSNAGKKIPMFGYVLDCFQESFLWFPFSNAWISVT